MSCSTGKPCKFVKTTWDKQQGVTNIRVVVSANTASGCRQTCEASKPSTDEAKPFLVARANTLFDTEDSVDCPPDCECDTDNEQPEGYPKTRGPNPKTVTVNGFAQKTISNCVCYYSASGEVQVTQEEKVGGCVRKGDPSVSYYIQLPEFGIEITSKRNELTSAFVTDLVDLIQKQKTK